MAGVTLRDFYPSDADKVLKLYLAENTWFEDIQVSREYILECSQRADFRFFIAEEGQKVVGFMGVLYFQNVGRAEVGPIVVSEKRRRNGVGASLTAKTLSFVAEKGIRRAVAKVKKDNLGAVSFFLRCGFSMEAVLRNYTQKGEDVVQLVHHLPVGKSF
jgi:[ribosomal protein S18]-alanine N-acetyltransferase